MWFSFDSFWLKLDQNSPSNFKKLGYNFEGEGREREEMPKQVIFALVVESALILLTSVLLVRPSLIFKNQTSKVSQLAHTGGMVLLCVTFCWSVIVGCLLTLNSIVIRL